MAETILARASEDVVLFARLGKDLSDLLLPHRQNGDGALDTLRRILRENAETLAAVAAGVRAERSYLGETVKAWRDEAQKEHESCAARGMTTERMAAKVSALNRVLDLLEPGSDSWDATLTALKEQIAATRNAAHAPVQEVDRGA